MLVLLILIKLLIHSIYISEIIEKQEPAPPIYIPTPKHILEARKAQNASERNSEPPDKKKRLEYVPESKTNNAYPTPTYIPSKLNVDTTNIVEGNTNSNGDDITGLLSELASEKQSDDENHSENVPKHDVEDIKKTKSSSSRHHHSSHKSSRSQSSRSHSDRDRKSSSSKSSHRSSSSSNKSKHSDKTKHSDRSSSKHRSERKSSSSSSSSSSKHRSVSHASKSSKKV